MKPKQRKVQSQKLAKPVQPKMPRLQLISPQRPQAFQPRPKGSSQPTR